MAGWCGGLGDFGSDKHDRGPTLERGLSLRPASPALAAPGRERETCFVEAPDQTPPRCAYRAGGSTPGYSAQTPRSFLKNPPAILYGLSKDAAMVKVFEIPKRRSKVR